jgi:hypothetical protein
VFARLRQRGEELVRHDLDIRANRAKQRGKNGAFNEAEGMVGNGDDRTGFGNQLQVGARNRRPHVHGFQEPVDKGESGRSPAHFVVKVVEAIEDQQFLERSLDGRRQLLAEEECRYVLHSRS